MNPEDLGARLAEHASGNNVPGAVLAVRRGDDITEAAYGVLDNEFGYPATVDSVFQTGSITKVWTATLIMQLADEGLLDLDQPVARHLPGFRVADEAASAAVTVRQLLCHVGGFDGDIFDDHGPGDDAVERYVDALAGPARQLFPPGALWSYCNSGYVVLGRIVEVLTGLTWEEALRERIAVPLGMTHALTSPAEAIRHRVAMGHLTGPDGEIVKAPVWSMPRSNAPAGSTLTLTARDQLRFAALHLGGGLAPDGTRVLSERSVLAMREPQAVVPGVEPLPGHWGLGWELWDWPGGRVIGHDGGTVGQAALLRVVPERDVAIALLTNGGDFHGLHALVAELLDELAGVRVPELPVPPAQPPRVDPRYFTGRYESATFRSEIAQDDGRLSVTLRPIGPAAVFPEDAEPDVTYAVPLDERTLIGLTRANGRHPTYTFVGDGDRAGYLHMGRAIPRA
ncbi:beta-lactamase family protein [Nonomuraea sp. NN258]|uniref:serine hydrolase domain-containing protein n=1 Tax=Nonomuraea antri TaxID=2730852 RepID=UPI0015684B3C|nr:serine hydrolase domain-containing protein [Nonomuraea antri]NRQ38278.1 beta-lactamase family protein [Nonomuraea antri]